MSAQEISKILLQHEAVKLSLDPPFTWASGMKTPIYCDNRLIMSFPESREKVINEMVELAKTLDFNVVAGTASSGIPWASWLADRLGLPMVYIRKKPKEYGRNRMMEGKLPDNPKAVVIEDLISTGGSAIHAVDALRESEVVVEDIIAIFTYGLERSMRNAISSHVNYHTLANLDSLLEIAKLEHYLSSEDHKKVITWAKDPEGWYYTYFM